MSCLDIYPASHMERPSFRLQAEPAPAMLSEVFAETPMDGAVTGFVLAQLGPGCKPVLWVQDRMSRREAGWPCLAGIRPGVDVLKVDVPSARDSLWTAEQGLDCPSFSAVIVEIWGDPPAVEFHGEQTLGAALGGPRCPLLASCADSRNPISALHASVGVSVRSPRTGMLSTFAHRACRAGGWNCSGRVCGRLAPGPPAMTRPINSWCWTATGPRRKQPPRRTSPARSERSRGTAPRRFFRCPA